MSHYRVRPLALATAALITGLSAGVPAVAAAQLLGPSAYLRATDSPFAGISGFGYFYLENFEDHKFDTPGVTASAGGVTSVVFGPSIHDSVDEDDGVLDGSGLRGDDYFYNSGQTGITFTFDAAALPGGLPTHAGLVWTDGANDIFFEAFDQNGASLGTRTGTHANSSVSGETAEDRFYGAVNPGGISRIVIRNGVAGIEVDHLQYGRLAQQAVVPEPVTLSLVGAGLLGVARRARRRR